MKHLLPILLAIGVAGAHAADKLSAPSTEGAGQGALPVSEITYKTVDGHDLKMSVVKPAAAQSGDRRPAIVFFFGGGWVSGKRGQFAPHSQYFASRGMVCFEADYRLLDKSGDEPPLPCVRDARSALRWVRAHAREYGIDPGRIAAAGGSAGGHLAAFTGLCDGLDDPADDLRVSAKPNALILFNPVFDNGPDQGWGHKRVQDRYPVYSPAHNITPDDPPAIIFLGTADKLIPVPVAERFRDRMKSAGIRCDLHLYDSQPHGFFNHGRAGNRYYHQTVTAADEFLASLGWLEGAPTLKP